MPHTPPFRHGRRPEPVETPGDGLVFTHHALKRMQQRAISREDVLLVLAYGREYHAGHGATAMVLGRRDVLREGKNGLPLDSAAGICVIVARDGTILTVQHIVEHLPRPWRAA